MSSKTCNIAIQLVLLIFAKQVARFLFVSAAWENSRHLTTLQLVSPPNVWETYAEIPCWWPFSTEIWVVLLIGRARGKFDSTIQKHYPDLGSDASSVWIFCARFSDVICRGTSGSVAKCRLFSQAIFVAYFSVPLMAGIICSRFRDTIEPPWTTSSRKQLPIQNTKIFSVNALQLEPLANDDLL